MSVKHLFNEFNRHVSVYELSKMDILKLKFKFLFFGKDIRGRERL